MRQPLVTMMRMASAFTQCVMRTTSGWIPIHCVCDGSIERPQALFRPWSETIAYTLQRLAPVSLAKAHERGGVPPAERDRLEQLAHFRGAHQAVRVVGEREEFRLVLGRSAGHHVGDAAVDQELGLAGVA